ncbi:hypothetical protein D9M72_651460 [compost metagenome]
MAVRPASGDREGQSASGGFGLCDRGEALRALRFLALAIDGASGPQSSRKPERNRTIVKHGRVFVPATVMNASANPDPGRNDQWLPGLAALAWDDGRD